MKGKGRKKAWSERSLTPSKLRTGKKGRKIPRKKPLRAVDARPVKRSVIGDARCRDAEFHTLEKTGYYDPNGHNITKQYYEKRTSSRAS